MNYLLLRPTSLIKINKEKGLRIICKENTVIHCHHYNARLQNTLESESAINGSNILRETAEQVYLRQIQSLLKTKNYSQEDSYQAISDLYSTMGYGNLFFDKIDENIVYSSSSHFVSGWECGSLKRDGKVCTVPEGYIAAALYAVTGTGHKVNEHSCMNEGKQYCYFSISKAPEKIIKLLEFNEVETLVLDEVDAISNIRKQEIVDAVETLPIYGNEDGLIPMFNVYLANTPQTFYNLVCIRYLEEMSKIGRELVAKLNLIRDAEFCAMNTFSGILNSDEWMAIIQPMIKNKSDNVFGLIAVANALGWGKIFIKEHTSGESLKLIVSNGYEAFGYWQLKKETAEHGQCFMMSGISSGLMSLIYLKGNFSDRLGTYQTIETNCVCSKDDHCEFHTKKL